MANAAGKRTAPAIAAKLVNARQVAPLQNPKPLPLLPAAKTANAAGKRTAPAIAAKLVHARQVVVLKRSDFLNCI
jgi:hypothetical protein